MVLFEGRLAYRRCEDPEPVLGLEFELEPPQPANPAVSKISNHNDVALRDMSETPSKKMDITTGSVSVHNLG